MMQQYRLLTLKELAKYLACSLDDVREMAEDGAIPSFYEFQIGYRFNLNEVLESLRNITSEDDEELSIESEEELSIEEE